jgi:tetratricopeptide (TPR) repeat protein
MLQKGHARCGAARARSALGQDALNSKACTNGRGTGAASGLTGRPNPSMKPSRGVVAAPVCLLAVLAGTVTIAPESGLGAESPATVLLSVGVSKPLMNAQADIRKENWNAAFEDIKQAQSAVNKTTKDEYHIDELFAYVLYRQNKYTQAAAVYERLLASPLMPAEQVDERTKAIAEMYFRTGNYSKAARWAEKYLERHPGQPDIAEMLGDYYFRMGEYEKAAATMTAVATNAERAKEIPRESWLRIIEDACYRLDNTQGVKNALVQLVRYYQKPQDWSELIDLYSQDVYDDRVALGYRRLMFDLHVLTRPDDYEQMAFDALNEGVPAEALQVLERGEKDGLFAGPHNLPGDYERLLKLVEERTAVSSALLPGLAAKAITAATGQDDVLIGQMYLSGGQYDQAIAAFKRAINKGGLQDADEVQISLGIAYLKQGLKHLADQAFEAVGQGSKWAGLARLWTLRVEDNASVS